MGDDGSPEAAAAGRPDPRGQQDSASAADRLWWYRDAREPSPVVRHDRLRWARREHLLDALACLSVSTLCFSQARAEVLSFEGWGFYNRVPVGPAVLVAFVLNVVVLAAVGVLGVRAMRRGRRPAGRRLAAVAAAALLLIALNFVRLTYETVDRWTDAIGGLGLLALVAMTLGASLAWPHRALHAARGLALGASPLAILTLGQALWMFLELAAGPVWRPAEPVPLGRTPPSLRRVVWVVLEELDQRIAFEARPAWLELPELDRLRRDSLYADGARPPAGTPEVAMPALITGRRVVAVAPANPNDLELTFTDGKTTRWSAHPNVFSRARTLGYDTAVIGWHLPYPRALGDSLGLAAFRPTVAHEQARGDTFGQTLGNQWWSLVPPVNDRRLLAQRLAELGDLAFRAAADGRFGLVLLHLPLPRAPGVYDPVTGRLTTWSFRRPGGGYLDNLALADRMLGELQHGLTRAHVDDRTWLVVSADRWWTAASRYDGQTDHRVPFLVRPPTGGRALHVDAPFNTLATHDLVLAILRGTILDTSDAAAWLARNPVAPPRDYTSAGRPIY